MNQGMLPAPEGLILSDEELTKLEDARQQKIAILTASLIERRKKAVDHRNQSGIEQEWMEAEEAYEGIDNANRATESPVGARMHKPRHDGGSMEGSRKTSSTRSTVFMNITRPYVDAASARVADMLLPSDDRNFALNPTPIPELAEAQGMQIPPEELKAFKIELEKAAKTKADAAQQRIDDWLTECQYHAEVRKVIEDCSRLGTGVLKGPFPVMSKIKSVIKTPEGQLALDTQEKIVPHSKRVSPWNVYPDPGCCDDVDSGAYVYEKDQINARQVRDLMEQPSYLPEALQECLKEGPNKTNASNDGRWRGNDDDNYEIWYFTGEITASDFQAVYKQDDAEGPGMRVIVSIINDRIVKVHEAPLDTEGFGYDFMQWQRRAEMLWGQGVAKQISVPQRMLNAATRRLSDNSSLSNAPQIVTVRGIVYPADGTYELYGGKHWLADPESSVDDIRKAFLAIDIPTRQEQLMNVIQFALKMAEDVTGMPLMMQGSQGTAPDTVGGMEILNTNANTILRRIARTFDDSITEPHMRRYYDWIMCYGDESEKGDFQIDARGSTSLVERDIQMRAILGMAEVVLDPRFGLDPELWAQESLRANKIDPAKLKLSDEKRAQMEAAAKAQMESEQAKEQKMLELAIEKVLQAREIAAEKAKTDLAIAQDNNDTKLVLARDNSQQAPAAAGGAGEGKRW